MRRAEEQHDLLALGPAALRADVLKVPHHGSAYQDPELLDVADPAVAVVSVGADNSYGHPHGPLVSRRRDRTRGCFAPTSRVTSLSVRTGQGLSVVTRGR